MSEFTREAWEQHPDEYRYDLNPEGGAGMNAGLAGQHPERASGVRTAYDIKDLHNRLQGFEDDDLKGIPVLPVGTRLEQGTTYIDLREKSPAEFTARSDMEAGPKNWYVPKSEIDYQVWNRLIGVDNPERLGAADEG